MNNETFEPRHNEMGRHIASGILSTGASQIVRVLCQFGSVLILSRLLPPSDFGVVAMASPVYGFVILFQDLGLGQATIQKQNLRHDEVNTFFWINVAVGLFLSLLLIGLSPLAGWYYKDARVTPLVAAMGALIIISALGTQHGAILQRRMQFRLTAALDAFSNLFSLTVAIVAAIVLKSYWALYYGMAAGTLFPVVSVWLLVRWRPSAPHLAQDTRNMLKFGAGITSSNVTSFIGRNFDNILIGRKWGDHELGLYDRAYKLLLFPLQRIVYPMSAVMIPVLSRLMNDPEQYRAIFLKTLSQLTFAIWPGIIWTIVQGDTLIPLLLGKNWSGVAPIFELLAVAGLLQVLTGLSGCLLISQARTGDYARIGFINTCICVAAFIIGLPYGALGVAAAYAISECIRTPFSWWYTGRKGHIRMSDMVSIALPLFASGLASAVALFCFREAVPLPEWLKLPVGLMISYAVAALTMCLFPLGASH